MKHGYMHWASNVQGWKWSRLASEYCVSPCRYCRVNYDPDREECRDVYLCLINMYLSPPRLEEYGISVAKSERPVRNVKAALDVLTAHHHLMDTTKVRWSSGLCSELCQLSSQSGIKSGTDWQTLTDAVYVVTVLWMWLEGQSNDKFLIAISFCIIIC